MCGGRENQKSLYLSLTFVVNLKLLCKKKKKIKDRDNKRLCSQKKIIKMKNYRNVSLLIQILCYFSEFYVCDISFLNSLVQCTLFSKQVVTYF